MRALLRRRAAIVLEAGKEYLLAPRLQGIAASAGCASVSDLVARLRHEPHGPLHQKVVEAMTTNETTFFRDLTPLRFPAQHRDPAPPRSAPPSAACASGRRPARRGRRPTAWPCLLRHHFPRLADWDLRIIGSDLSSDAVTRAREGRYTQLEVGRGLPASMLASFLERRGTGWAVNSQVRALVDFQIVNLAEPLPFARQFDVVLLRNVLTYFDSTGRDQVVSRVRATLRDLASSCSARRSPRSSSGVSTASSRAAARTTSERAEGAYGAH